MELTNRSVCENLLPNFYNYNNLIQDIEGKYQVEYVIGANEEIITSNVDKTAQIIKRLF